MKKFFTLLMMLSMVVGTYAIHTQPTRLTKQQTAPRTRLMMPEKKATATTASVKQAHKTPARKQHTVTRVARKATLAESTVTFGADEFKGKGTNSGQGEAITITKDGVTFATNAGYGDDKGNMRVYAGGEIKLTASANISKVVFACNSSYYQIPDQTPNSTTCTVTIPTGGRQARITGITVTLGEGGTPNPPAPTGDTITVTGLQYADASYYEAVDGNHYWDFTLYKDYDEDAEEFIYPLIYIDTNEKAVNRTKIAGTYTCYYAGYWKTAKDSIDADEPAGQLTITYVSNGNYRFEGWFKAQGKIVKFNTVLETIAYDDEYNDITLTDGGNVPGPTGDEITVAEALEIGNALANNTTTTETYSVVGYVGKVIEQYSDQYSNMSVWMTDTQDDGTGYYDFEAYRCTIAAPGAKQGDRIRVTGKILKYVSKNNKTTIEIANGTMEVLGDDEEEGDTIVLDSKFEEAQAVRYSDGGDQYWSVDLYKLDEYFGMFMDYPVLSLSLSEEITDSTMLSGNYTLDGATYQKDEENMVNMAEGSESAVTIKKVSCAGYQYTGYFTGEDGKVYTFDTPLFTYAFDEEDNTLELTDTIEGALPADTINVSQGLTNAVAGRYDFYGTTYWYFDLLGAGDTPELYLEPNEVGAANRIAGEYTFYDAAYADEKSETAINECMEGEFSIEPAGGNNYRYSGWFAGTDGNIYTFDVTLPTSAVEDETQAEIDLYDNLEQITVAEALEIIKNLENNTQTKQMYSVVGVITKVSNAWSEATGTATFYMDDTFGPDTKNYNMQVLSATAEDSLAWGDYIFADGYLKKAVGGRGTVTYQIVSGFVENQTVTIEGADMQADYFSSEGLWQLYIPDEDGSYDFISYVNSKNTESCVGEYTADQIYLDYTLVADNYYGQEIYMTDGYIRIKEVAEGELDVICCFISEEGQGIKVTYQGALYDYFQYDEDDDFTYEFANTYVPEVGEETLEKGYTVVSVESDTVVIAVDFEGIYELDPNTTIPAGTYTINYSTQENTCYASAGFDEYYYGVQPTAVYTLVEEDGELYYNRMWFLVEGTITVAEYDNNYMKVSVAAKNTLGKNVNVIFYLPKNPATGIDSQKADGKISKMLREGQMLIQKGGKTYNVLGATIR